MFEIPQNCCDIKHIAPNITFDIDFGAIKRVPKTLSSCGIGSKVLLVADENTWQAAGRQINEVLLESGCKVSTHVFKKLECADMETAKQLSFIAAEKDCDGILAVGTGTINDLCRYAAFLTGKKYAVAGTAASMDGFCSGVAPLIENGFKRTYNAITPFAVIGDGDVLDKAPIELTAAGLGDLLGKYTCLADWKIAHILTGEYFCPGIEKMVRDAVDQAVAASQDIKEGRRGAALPLMKALCLSGVAMALCGSSRPASGAEHHLSHFWEMRFLMEGKKPVFHGTKVGVATVVVSGIYHSLLKYPDISDFVIDPPALTAERLKRAYGVLTDDVLRDNAVNPLDKVTKQSLIQNWREICEIIRQIPAAGEIAAIISKLGGPTETAQIGISDELKLEGILFGRYVRPRLTLLRAADILNCPL